MSNPTLELLRREWVSPCPALTSVRERYFPHIRTDKHLQREIDAGHIALRYTRLHNSSRAKPVVYLTDLADYLDSLAPPKPAEPAASSEAA